MSGSTLINKLTTDLINRIIIEFKKSENREKINEEVIHPVMFYISEYLMNKLFPFFVIGITIFILTFIFVLIIMILIIRLNFKQK